MAFLEGGDIFAEDFRNQERRIAREAIPSEIQSFYAGTTILVTGGTGFLGKVLLEKLLRTCWQLKRIYLLMRAKKGKSPRERFEDLFEGPLYENLKAIRPGFRDQVTLVIGDCALPNMGLSEEERQMLIREVNIIFHCAATVRFDEKIRVAINININGTRVIMGLGREMKNLKALVHVSTAYANCPRKAVDEKIYKVPYNYKDLFKLLEILSDAQLDALTPELISPWPNTYTFTKIHSESVVADLGKGLPVGIIRPSIVTSSAYEPVCGWINNFYGPQGVTVGAAMGMLRTLHCDADVIADLVPVDMVTNAAIAFAWDIAQTRGDNPNFEKISIKEAEEMTFDGDRPEKEGDDIDPSDIPVLNYVSSEKKPITWGMFMNINYRHGVALGSMVSVWHYCLTLNKNYYMDLAYQIFLHFIPAIFVDTIARLIGRKPVLWYAYKKIKKFSAIISYFCTNQWKFSDRNVWKVWDKLSDRDKQLFNFNIAALDWEEYLFTYLRGLRVYITKDDMSTVPQAVKRTRRLKYIHYTAVGVILLLMLSVLWKIFSTIFF